MGDYICFACDAGVMVGAGSVLPVSCVGLLWRGLRSVVGCLGLALVFVWGGAPWGVGGGGLIAIFRGCFTSAGGDFILAGGLGAGLSLYWV